MGFIVDIDIVLSVFKQPLHFLFEHCHDISPHYRAVSILYICIEQTCPRSKLSYFIKYGNFYIKHILIVFLVSFPGAIKCEVSVRYKFSQMN